MCNLFQREMEVQERILWSDDDGAASFDVSERGAVKID